jgi:predicted amidophosphoribosyltransferase
MLDISRLDPQTAGFGNRGRCAYRDVSRVITSRGEPVAPWAVCFACAHRTMRQLADERCEVCGQELDDDGTCPNVVCRFSDRGYDRIWPIAQRTGALERAINRYKFDGKYGRALIFGRVLVGFLDAHEAAFREFELIVPSPTWTGEGGRPFDHTWRILEAAALESFGAWPFEQGVIVKTSRTTPFARMYAVKSWHQRRAISESELRGALYVPDPLRVAGKKVLVFDDVFTDG